jgi:hypothetical protein
MLATPGVTVGVLPQEAISRISPDKNNSTLLIFMIFQLSKAKITNNIGDAKNYIATNVCHRGSDDELLPDKYLY